MSENTTIINLKKICSKLGIISHKKENHAVRDVVQQLRIAVADVKNPVSSLSGGNQQKVVIAKWMFGSADIVIFDEPTKGVDGRGKNRSVSGDERNGPAGKSGYHDLVESRN